MANINSDNELEMARFGEYLLKSRVVQEKYAPYYVRWVRKFMDLVPDRPTRRRTTEWTPRRSPSFCGRT